MAEAAAAGAEAGEVGQDRGLAQPSGGVFSVGCYNVLCATYAVKWGEREGKGPDGESNWSLRWPVMCGYITRACWDVVCLQEVEHTDRDQIVADLGKGYEVFYFKHEQRPPDGVMIAVKSEAWAEPQATELQHNGVAFGRVDAVHRASGCRVCLVTAHCRGGRTEQLAALADFAEAPGPGGALPDVAVITGDFNEDFRQPDGQVRCPFPSTDAGHYVTLCREAGLPDVSRPPHKQLPDQTSGKGKIDYIFVRGRAGACEVALERDAASARAMQESHAPCAATGQWASDHGCEALSVRLLTPLSKH